MKRFSEINSILEEHREIKIISFDLFDTLLLRRVFEPADIFTLVGEKLCEGNADIASVEYKYIRIQAEKQAREKKLAESGSSEVTLREIADQIPQWLTSTLDLERAELETEAEMCYANPEMADFLRRCETEGYHIIYTSDMYLTKGQLRHILKQAGLPPHELFVSCEYGKTKKSGELFDVVLETFRLEPGMLIHIGDNAGSDVLACEKRGIFGILYDHIWRDENATLTAERYVRNGFCAEVHALRHIAACSRHCQEDMPWYALGASVYGPLIAYFMEWIYTKAEKDDVERIVFLMREGEFLKRAWDLFTQYKKSKIAGCLAYVSRRSLMLASLEEWNERAFENMIASPKITVREIFHILDLDPDENGLKEFADTPRLLFETEMAGDSRLIDRLKQVVSERKNAQKISAKIAAQKKMAYAYFEQLGINGKTATVDIGYQGTIQKGMEALFEDRKDVSWEHYLLFCNGETRLKEMDARSNIYGALGTFGGNRSEQMSVINKNNRSLEMLFLASCGSTEAYQDVNGQIVPVLGELMWDEAQSHKISRCQEGALHFLELYLKAGSPKIRKGELLGMLNRLLMTPNHIEAEMLGGLVFDENFGSRFSRQVCTDAEIEAYKGTGMLSLKSTVPSREIQWLEGIQAIAYPEYILNRGNSVLEPAEIYAANLVHIVCRKGIDKINVVAAGSVGRLAVQYAYMCGIKVLALTDNNEALWGTEYRGIPIVGLRESDRRYPYIVATILHTDALIEQIREVHGQDAVIIA